jgi:hypothetical protein
MFLVRFHAWGSSEPNGDPNVSVLVKKMSHCLFMSHFEPISAGLSVFYGLITMNDVGSICMIHRPKNNPRNGEIMLTLFEKLSVPLFWVRVVRPSGQSTALHLSSKVR